MEQAIKLPRILFSPSSFRGLGARYCERTTVASPTARVAPRKRATPGPLLADGSLAHDRQNATSYAVVGLRGSRTANLLTFWGFRRMGYVGVRR